jgi:VWFA-related protein
MIRHLLAAVTGLLCLPIAVFTQQPPAAPEPGRGATQAQQRPVFRGGTHFVRVDAYPVQDGRIVEGLQPEDFEILEDGKPQQIESFDFIRFDTFTPDAERRDPQSQRAGFDLAADPRYRVFAIFVDMTFSSSAGPFAAIDNLPHLQQPLVNFLDRVIGPRDLYGFLTSRNSAKDLVLAQKTAVTIGQIKDLWRASIIDKDEADVIFGACPPHYAGLAARYRADQTYSTLTDLVHQLGALRQERKNVVFASNLLPRWRPDTRGQNASDTPVPRVGISEGRIVPDSRKTSVSGDPSACERERHRLLPMDFDMRYRQLLADARRENVSFYVIAPGGLQTAANVAARRAVDAAYDGLKSLADETDGIAVVDTNDLNAGMKRIADDLAAYYVLGYYTTNTRFDGGLRTLKVRYKAGGNPIRARRQYRAPTEAEIAALSRSMAAQSGPSPIETALTVLERGSRPFAIYTALAGSRMTVVAELSAAAIQAGRWKEGADVEVEAASADGAPLGKARGRIEAGNYSAAVPVTLAPAAAPARVAVRLTAPGAPVADDWAKLTASPSALVADPIAYRSSSRSAVRPVAAFDFARNERIRVEWPMLGTLDRREVRLLDRAGKPLPVELPLSEESEKKQLVVAMSLSGLGRGDYLIELTAGAGAVTERKLIALRIK